MESFGVFVNFGVNLRQLLLERNTNQPTLCLVTLENLQNYEFFQKIDEKRVKILKKETFWIFATFGDYLKFFHLKNSNYLFGKPTGKQRSALLSVFHILIHDVYEKKLHKNVKKQKTFGFLSFSVSI